MHRINRTWTALLVLAVGAIAAGQEHEADPEAMKAFADMVAGYRQRPALTVRSKATIELEQDGTRSAGEAVEAEITFDRKGRGVVKLRGYTCYLGDGKLHAVHDGTDHSYFSESDDGSPYYALMTAFIDIPYPHLAIAFGEQEVDEFFCMQFHPKAPWVRPTSVEEETAEDGRVRRRIRLTSDNGSLDVLVDPKTGLMESVHATLTEGIFVQAGTTLHYRHTFEYETFEDVPLDPAILAFDPGTRQRVDTLTVLAPKPAPGPGGGGGGGGGGQLVGKPAPALVLPTLDGQAIDLEELRGQVVVLDFWATWCGPCRAALPALHEVADWAREQQLPVRVITVNVFEREADANARREKVRRFWADNGHKLPVAIDFTGDVAGSYGVRAIPATFVVRSDGVVHAQHSGAGPNYADSLKADIRAAMDALESDGQ
ncbi:MAG: TlpA family protein disulfide reductase [Planctomycetota bacterium]|jgi:thiol-disulfide isomerase/thioredoxin